MLQNLAVTLNDPDRFLLRQRHRRLLTLATAKKLAKDAHYSLTVS
jgi:hypothetical protein